MNDEIDQALIGELLPGERILWSGKPSLAVVFSKGDIFLVPFSLIWFGFVIFWFVAASSGGGAFGLFGIPFVIIGFYFVFGRFLYKSHKKKGTGYAITNKRIITVFVNSRGERKSLTTSDLKSIQSESLSTGASQTGSILFGTIPFYYGFYLNTGMDPLMRNLQNGIPAFFDIEDAEHVYNIYKQAKYETA